MSDHIKFRDGDDILTLWPEKDIAAYDSQANEVAYIVGWCPEKQNTFVVHPENVVREEQPA